MKNLNNLQHKLKSQVEKKYTEIENTKRFLPTGKIQNSGKKKVTFYLTSDHESMINEIYAMKMMLSEKIDKSQIVCNAIKIYFDKIKGA